MSRSGNPPTGVLLINLGGPGSLEEVEPFLFNLFSDPDIITLPFGFQWMLPLLARRISRRRSKVAREYYRAIGGRSPITELTEAQRSALDKALQNEGNYRVFVGMRYWHPNIEEALNQIILEGIKRVVLLPLFPQYSVTSSGSGLNEWNLQVKKRGVQLNTVVIDAWYNHPLYIQAVIENIEEGKKRFQKEAPGEVEILFSAHGVPEKVILKGDPYQRQIEETLALVKEQMGKENIFHLAYQSKVGRLKWIGPSVEEKLKELAGRKVQKVLAVPISFVSDHSETLYEIDILFGKLAKELGIPWFYRMPSLNASPTFIRALKEIVTEKSK